MNEKNVHPCPECGTTMDAWFVDIGVGLEQAGPYVCPSCLYVQPGCLSMACAMAKCKSWNECAGRSKLWFEIKKRDDAIATALAIIEAKGNDGSPAGRYKHQQSIKAALMRGVKDA